VEAVLNLPLLAAVPNEGSYRLHLENANGNKPSPQDDDPGSSFAEDSMDQNVRPTA
jgi:hypothetical protein